MSEPGASDVGAVLSSDRRDRRRRLWLAGIGVAIVAAGAGGLVMLARSRAEADGPRFKTATVERGDLRVTVTATGTLEARNTVDVGAEVTGRLLEVPVDFNDQVEAGALLARIDPQPFQLAVSESRARLGSARATVQTARANANDAARRLVRTEALAKDGLSSAQDLDTARAAAEKGRAEVAAALAKVEEASAALETAETRLNKTAIRAPIAGIVLDRKVEAGQTVTAGFQTPVLFTLAANLSQMELNVAVDEADVGKVGEGQDATFTVDAWPGRTFRSKVLKIRNVARVENKVVTYEAVLSVENEDRALRPGMTATAVILASNVEAALLVPNGAFRFRPPQDPAAGEQKGPGGSPFMMRPPMRRWGPERASLDGNGRNSPTGTVYVLVDGEPTAKKVQRGPSDGTRTVVLGDELKAGDEVVLETLEKTGG